MDSIFYTQNFWIPYPQLPQVPHRIYIIFLYISYSKNKCETIEKKEWNTNNILKYVQKTKRNNLLNKEHKTATFSPPLFRSAILYLLKTICRLCLTFTLAPCPRPLSTKNTLVAFIFSTASPLVGLLKRINFASLQTMCGVGGMRGGGDVGLMGG